MMDRFNQFIEQIFKNEGGYVNHPSDPGGETNYGITKRTAVAYGYKGDMKLLPKAIAKEIYLEEYWERYHCEQYPYKTSFMVFDAYVNHSPKTVNRMIQRALGVADDGILGAKSRKAINDHSDLTLFDRFTAERLKQYTTSSKFPTFGRGWVNRIADNLRFLA